MEARGTRREKARLPRNIAHNLQPGSQTHRRFQCAERLGKEQLGQPADCLSTGAVGTDVACFGKRPYHRTFTTRARRALLSSVGAGFGGLASRRGFTLTGTGGHFDDNMR